MTKSRKHLIEDEELTEYEDMKAKALADYLGIELEDVEQSSYNDSVYETSEGDYFVGTYDEAYAEAKESIEDLFDEMGLESFTPSFQEWITNWCLETSYIDDMMREYYENYVYDIEDEGSYNYENRLIEEMYDNDILTDDDFELDEDGEIDYYTLKDSVDLDEKRSEYIDELVNSMDPVEWLKDLYGSDSISEFIKEHEYLIDLDKIVDEAISIDGIAHFIATYDGDEIELDDDLFAYRVN